MKKQVIICLLSLIIFQALPAGAVQTISANPINIAARIALEQDSTKIASSLEYYGYAIQPYDKEYTVFKHQDGTIIRFPFPKLIQIKHFP